MNFLAHLYLSGDSEKIKLGNFIGDYVKGNKYQKFTSEIQKGILLHRNIDYFTDRHPLVLESSNRFKKEYKRYSGVVVDLIYDHFLAKSWAEYHTLPLKKYVTQSHEIFIRNYLILPSEVKFFLPFLIQSRRLESYATISGLKTALEIMSRRTSLPNHSNFAIETLHLNYKEFELEFRLFMSEIMAFVSKTFQITLTTPSGWHPNEGKQTIK